MESTENLKSLTDGTSDLLETGLNEIVMKLRSFRDVHSLMIATMGALLEESKKGKKYKKYASHIEKFHDFLREMDIPFTRAKQYMDIWKYWGERLISEGCDIEKLIKALPIVRKGGDKEEWFNKARMLSHADFNNEVYMTKGHRHSSICDHSRLIDWQKCKDCGAWIPKGEPHVES